MTWVRYQLTLIHPRVLQVEQWGFSLCNCSVCSIIPTSSTWIHCIRAESKNRVVRNNCDRKVLDRFFCTAFSSNPCRNRKKKFQAWTGIRIWNLSLETTTYPGFHCRKFLFNHPRWMISKHEKAIPWNEWSGIGATTVRSGISSLASCLHICLLGVCLYHSYIQQVLFSKIFVSIPHRNSRNPAGFCLDIARCIEYFAALYMFESDGTKWKWKTYHPLLDPWTSFAMEGQVVLSYRRTLRNEVWYYQLGTAPCPCTDTSIITVYWFGMDRSWSIYH